MQLADFTEGLQKTEEEEEGYVMDSKNCEIALSQYAFIAVYAPVLSDLLAVEHAC